MYWNFSGIINEKTSEDYMAIDDIYIKENIFHFFLFITIETLNSSILAKFYEWGMYDEREFEWWQML